MPSKTTTNSACLGAFALWVQLVCKLFFSGTEKLTRQILVNRVLVFLKHIMSAFSSRTDACMVNARYSPDRIAPLKSLHPFLILKCRSFYISNEKNGRSIIMHNYVWPHRLIQIKTFFRGISPPSTH